MIGYRISLSTADTSPNTSPILLNGEIGENLAAAASLGYDAIEIHMREDAAFDAQEIRRGMAQNHVAVSALITGRLNTEGICSLTDDRPYVYRAAMEGMRSYIDRAAEIETDLVIGWIRGRIPQGKPRKTYLDRLADAMRVLNQRAVEKNVKLYIEVINRYETNIFNTCAETLEFIEANALDNCYVHLDTFHMGIEESDMLEALRTAGSKLGYLHLADNNRRTPGTGSFDFGKILETLDAISYKGYLSVECLPIPDGMTAARDALAYIKSCRSV